ncbi:uncharacterized protein LOC134281694 [Saccostrea cucullata]|uniref:uncharacterized protein LOC134281694 n=1 Tax=Saccostrea cuccullata TaxID=36930 RepID=UPI002ED590C1
MPTSSQALIILAVDGRLPKKIPRRTFPVTSVPYPLRDYNMTDTCMTIENCNEEDADDVIKLLKAGERLQYPTDSESLSELLQITGYKGALTFDPVSRLIQWQINTELPPNTKNTRSFENPLKLPSIHGRENQMGTQITDEKIPFHEENSHGLHVIQLVEDPPSQQNAFYSTENQYQTMSQGMTSKFANFQKSERYLTQLTSRDFLERDKIQNLLGDHNLLSARENTNGTTEGVVEESDSKVKRTVSLPSLFKARIDKDLYRRLCSLGFRKSEEMKKETRKQTKYQQRKPIEHPTKEAWVNEAEEMEYSKDRDFRLEDLSLQTGNLHVKSEIPSETNSHNVTLEHNMQAAKLSHLLSNKDYQNYFKERDAFFEKFENYESYTTGGGLNLISQGKEMLAKGCKLPHIQQPVQRYGDEQDIDDVNVVDTNNRRKESKKTLLEEIKEKSNYSKWKKRRLVAVRMRKEMPPLDPLCLCFNLPDNAMSHEEVKALVEENCGGPIGDIQFDPVNVVAIDSEARSRWIVRMRDMKSRDRLLQTGIVIDGERRDVKLMDIIHQEEVDAYKFHDLVQRGKLRMPLNQATKKRKKSKTN